MTLFPGFPNALLQKRSPARWTADVTRTLFFRLVSTCVVTYSFGPQFRSDFRRDEGTKIRHAAVARARRTKREGKTELGEPSGVSSVKVDVGREKSKKSTKYCDRLGEAAEIVTFAHFSRRDTLLCTGEIVGAWRAVNEWSRSR